MCEAGNPLSFVVPEVRGTEMGFFHAWADGGRVPDLQQQGWRAADIAVGDVGCRGRLRVGSWKFVVANTVWRKVTAT